MCPSLSHVTRAPSMRVLLVALLAAALLVGCDGAEDSPIQADDDVVQSTPTPDDIGPDQAPSGAGGLTGDQGNDSPAVNGDDNVAGDEVPPDDDELTAEDTGVEIEPTVVEAELGDNVTVTGILATYLSDQVITLEGVTLRGQPAPELLIIIPPETPADDEAFDEGSLVAVTGEVVQMTDLQLAAIDREIFREHGEFLEGFRSTWGIHADDVSVAEEGQE